MVSTRCASSERQLGALREEVARERRAPQHAEAYRGTHYRVSEHQIQRGQRAAQSSTRQGNAEPLCARIGGAKRRVSERKADL